MGHRQVSDKALGFATSALEMALQVVVFISLTMALSVALNTPEEFKVYKSLLILIPVVVGYLARKYINKFGQFVLVHIILIIGAVIIAETDADTAVNFISVAVYTAYSIRLKNLAVQLRMATVSSTMTDAEAEKEAALRSMAEGEKIPLYCAVCMIIGYFAAYSKDNVLVMELEILLCVLFVILQIVYGNTLSLYQVFRINKDKSNFPAHQMKRVTWFVTMLSVVLIVLGMMVFYQGEYGSIFTLVKNGLLWFGKFLARMLLAFLGAFGKNAEQTPVEETTEEFESEEFESVAEANGDFSQFMEALAEVFGVVLIIASIIGIILVIREYIRNFNRTKNFDNDIIENVKPKEESVKVEKSVTLKTHKATKTEKNVRKIYKKLVLQGNKGKAPDGSHTPTRLTEDNITKDQQLAGEVTYIYEKARYSNEPVTKDDVDKMKQLQK